MILLLKDLKLFLSLIKQGDMMIQFNKSDFPLRIIKANRSLSICYWILKNQACKEISCYNEGCPFYSGNNLFDISMCERSTDAIRCAERFIQIFGYPHNLTK